MLGSRAADPDGASTDVAVFANNFINNVAVIEDVGASPINAGGGLRLTAVHAQVLDNRFVGNRTCGVCSGTNNGGGLAVLPAIEADFVTSADNIVAGNTFSDNWGRMGCGGQYRQQSLYRYQQRICWQPGDRAGGSSA